MIQICDMKIQNKKYSCSQSMMLYSPSLQLAIINIQYDFTGPSKSAKIFHCKNTNFTLKELTLEKLADFGETQTSLYLVFGPIKNINPGSGTSLGYNV